MLSLPYIESVAGVVITLATARRAIYNTKDTPLFYRCLNSTIAAFGFWLAVSSIPAMLPVLMNTSLTVISHNSGSMVVKITATKVQDCDWIRTDVYVLSSVGSVLTKANLLPVGDSVGSSRPVGNNDFGLWRIEYDPSISVSGVQLKTKHECGHRWPVETVQGPFFFHLPPPLSAPTAITPPLSLPTSPQSISSPQSSYTQVSEFEEDKPRRYPVPTVPVPPVFPIPQIDPKRVFQENFHQT